MKRSVHLWYLSKFIVSGEPAAPYWFEDRSQAEDFAKKVRTAYPHLPIMFAVRCENHIRDDSIESALWLAEGYEPKLCVPLEDWRIDPITKDELKDMGLDAYHILRKYPGPNL